MEQNINGLGLRITYSRIGLQPEVDVEMAFFFCLPETSSRGAQQYVMAREW
jgi:hypothetical protein